MTIARVYNKHDMDQRVDKDHSNIVSDLLGMGKVSLISQNNENSCLLYSNIQLL